MKRTLIFFLIISINLYSQEYKENDYDRLYNLNLSYQNGKIINSNRFIRGVNQRQEPLLYFSAFSASVNYQTRGEHIWERIYNYPQYGIGISYHNFENPEELGSPLSLFGNFSSAFKRWDKFSFEYKVGIGIAFNWKKYSESNEYNIAIGSYVTLHSDFSLALRYRPTDKFSVLAAVTFSHFSNGSVKEPNYGINMIAPRIGLSYNLNYDRINFKEYIIPKFESINEILISPFFAIKSISYKNLGLTTPQKNYGVTFPVYGSSFLYNRQVSYTSKFGIGLNISYDKSLNASAVEENGKIKISYGKTSDNFTLSLISSYELVTGRFSTILQPSFYIFRKSAYYSDIIFYQRIGLKYKLSEKLFVIVALRSNKFKDADYIEWTIAYNII